MYFWVWNRALLINAHAVDIQGKSGQETGLTMGYSKKTTFF